MSRLTRVTAVALFAALALAASAAAASAQNVWTAVANTGAVDESGRNLYVTSPTGSIFINSGVASGTLEVRYNVTGVTLIGETATPADPDSDLESQNCIRLDAKLRDTGAGSRVIVRVNELNEAEGLGGSGEMRTLGVIDSDTTGVASPEYVGHSICLPVPKEYMFNYAFRSYVIDVQLIKTNPSANPGLKQLRLCSRGACTP
jgi:hypothetical protein